MSLVMDTLRASPVTEDLTDPELKILAELIGVRSYKPGDVIVQPGERHDNLHILAQGSIQVNIQSSDGEAAIYMLKPGDLAGIITFVGGAPWQHSATLIAKSEAKLLSLPRSKFETLLDTHPMTAYKFMRGMVRYVHGIVRSMNAKSTELANYIYRGGGGY